MKSIKQQMRRARLAVVALGLIGATPSAFAAGTDFGTDITNTASVNYSVSGVPQTAINSSPTGNSTPGTAGVPTTFKVDKKIIFVAEETNNAATVTSPGLTQVVTVFRVTQHQQRCAGLSAWRLTTFSHPRPSSVEPMPSTCRISRTTSRVRRVRRRR